MLFLALFTASLRFARRASAQAQTTRDNAYLLTETLYPVNDDAAEWKNESGTKTKMSFSRGDRTVFAVKMWKYRPYRLRSKTITMRLLPRIPSPVTTKKWTKIKTTQKRTRPHDHPLNNKKGTTLVELMVCLVLLALFGTAAVTLVKPCAEAYIEVQQLTRAQNLADALTETIRGELADADGTISIVNAATESDEDSADADSANNIFIEDARLTEGTALRFTVESSYTEI